MSAILCCLVLARLTAGDAVVVDAAGNTTVNGALTVVGPFTSTGSVKGTAEVDTAGWTTYADVAGSAPVDGTGGTANATWIRTTTSPLDGTASFVLVKDAANRQGQGASFDFTIPDGDKQRTFEITFDALSTSAAYVTGDLQIFVFDRDLGVLVDTPIKIIPGDAINRKHFIGFFRTSASVNYRLIFHVATTSAVAYSMYFDRIAVRPNSQIVTGWQAFTPVIDAVTTNPTKGATREELCRWRRAGHNIEIDFFYEQTSAGTAGSGTYKFKLPEGLLGDTSVVKADSGSSVTTRSSLVGKCMAVDSATLDPWQGVVTLFDASSLALQCVFSTGTPQARFASSALFTLSNVNMYYSFQASIPIAGWDS